MTKIHTLSPPVIAKIAAGQVVERPAYAVKELIENAIDAGATSIRIEIEKGGLESIIVTDNGEGMSREDLNLSFMRHTTSKISKDDDLLAIKSMGFRGEALASIAAISDMTIISRVKDTDTGYMVELIGGKVQKNAPIGAPVGTTVIVNDLFYTVPARQKFLKSTQTEFRHIVEIISNIALAFPSIRFALFHNKKLVLQFPETTDWHERIHGIMENFLQHSIPINAIDAHVEMLKRL